MRILITRQRETTTIIRMGELGVACGAGFLTIPCLDSEPYPDKQTLAMSSFPAGGWER